MGKSNGQAEVRIEDKRHSADLEHELPAADPGDGFDESAAGAPESSAAAAAPGIESPADAEARRTASASEMSHVFRL